MEVYGEKPKRFTAEWWDYIWYYYKWHIIATVVAVFMVGVGLTQCANSPKYDLQVTVVRKDEVVFTQKDLMTEYVQNIVDDVTGNGKNEAYVSSIATGSEGNAEMQQAQYSKLMVEMSVPESYVFIMTREVADMAIKNEILEKTEVWAEDMESDGYVVSLKGNEQLKKFGIDSDNEELFCGVTILIGDKQDDELEQKRHENGIKFARKLVGLE